MLLNIRANLPTLKLGYLLVRTIPIISVPPVDPVEDKILAQAIPTRVPPIKTLVNKSSIRGLSGIGIIIRIIVCNRIAYIVLAQKLLLILKKAKINKGIFKAK